MKSAFRNNKNGARGVHCTPAGRWIASAQINGKKKYIGSYDTLRQAQHAYQQAIEEAQGVEMLQAQKA
jgi:hypothetical protein